MPLIPAPLQASTVPQFTVDGRVQPDLARDLTLLQIEEDVNGMQRMLANFMAIGPSDGRREQQLHWLDGAVLDFGKTISVSMGPSSAREEVFSGKVSALELSMEQGRAPEVVCLAEDRLMDLRMTHRFRTFENMSDADVVQQIASQHGLSAQTDVPGPTWQIVQQWNQSDLAFLRERARRLAAEVWVKDNALHVATREKRNGNAVTLIQGGNLMQVRLRADLAHQRTKVAIGGFDDADQDSIDEEAGASDIAAEAQGNTNGAQVLERAFGERVSYRVREVPLQDSQATALARAALLSRARRFVSVAGVADGSTAIHVGSLLRLERVSPLFEGDGFYVTRVRHQFDLDSGYRTHFDAERAWTGGVHDPDPLLPARRRRGPLVRALPGRGERHRRHRAQGPHQGDVPCLRRRRRVGTAWATLLTPYADDDQGLEILPEVGSQVVVGFEAGDPTRPYIVGACWNGSRALPTPAQSANNLRTLKTRSGSVLQFDDTQGAAKVTVSMQSGHRIVLDDAAQDITVQHSNGCKFNINVAGQVTIMANATVEITASAVNVHAPTVMCDGIVQCTTLIASAGVISPMYTPGAGNIW